MKADVKCAKTAEAVSVVNMKTTIGGYNYDSKTKKITRILEYVDKVGPNDVVLLSLDEQDKWLNWEIPDKFYEYVWS